MQIQFNLKVKVVLMTHLTSITSTQFSKFAVANVPVADGFCDTEERILRLISEQPRWSIRMIIRSYTLEA